MTQDRLSRLAALLAEHEKCERDFREFRGASDTVALLNAVSRARHSFVCEALDVFPALLRLAEAADRAVDRHHDYVHGTADDLGVVDDAMVALRAALAAARKG